MHPGLSSQPPQNKVHEQNEDHHSTPEYPLVLLRTPFNHTYSIATYTQRRAHVIQLSLSVLQHVPLVAEISQHRSSTLNILVQRSIRGVEEGRLAQDLVLPSLVAAVWRLIGAVAVDT